MGVTPAGGGEFQPLSYLAAETVFVLRYLGVQGFDTVHQRKHGPGSGLWNIQAQIVAAHCQKTPKRMGGDHEPVNGCYPVGKVLERNDALNIFLKSENHHIFNTPEEKDFLVRKFAVDCSCSDIVGMGVEFDPSCLCDNKSSLQVPSNYVLYAGRIDESKGCRELFEFWGKYKKNATNDLSLVLIGSSQMDIPERKDVVHLGFVGEEDKFRVMAKAKCLIMPSLYESLSIVIMESWLCGRPVLVNSKCNVLTGQCRRSNGGLWYENFDEFEACLNFISTNENISRSMAECGRKYTTDNYDNMKIY